VGFLSYVLRRLSLLGLVLLGVSMVVFFVLRGMPGVDPLAAYIAPGFPMSQEALNALRRELHLDEPLPVQYFYYVVNLLRGDWGYSRTAAQPVLDALLGRLPATVELAVFAVLLSTGIGVPAGVIAALKKDRLPDIVVRVVSITGISFPVFWLGIILQLVFFYHLGALGLPSLPSRGRVGEVIALELDGGAWAELGDVPGILGLVSKDGRVECTVDSAAKRLPTILKWLHERNVSVRDVEVREPDLEEVFVELAK